MASRTLWMWGHCCSHTVVRVCWWRIVPEGETTKGLGSVPGIITQQELVEAMQALSSLHPNGNNQQEIEAVWNIEKCPLQWHYKHVDDFRSIVVITHPAIDIGKPLINLFTRILGVRTIRTRRMILMLTRISAANSVGECCNSQQVE